MSANKRPISVAPYRRRDGGLEILLARSGEGVALITGEALPRLSLHMEAQSLAAAAARVSGPVQKMPLGRIETDGAPVSVFALEVLRGPEPDGAKLVWKPLEEALKRIPAAVGEVLSLLPGRIRLTARRRAA